MDRRTLLKLVGRAGGVAAVLTTMKAMRLLDSASTGTERPNLLVGFGEGVNKNASRTSIEAFGDTKTQTVGV